LVQSLLFDVSAIDPGAFAAAPTLVLIVAIVAAWLPARWAARIDPAEALRQG